VRADGGEQDGRHLGVHHAAACCQGVGGGSGGGGHNEAVALGRGSDEGEKDGAVTGRAGGSGDPHGAGCKGHAWVGAFATNESPSVVLTDAKHWQQTRTTTTNTT
jgi:hypothetical protein